MKHLHAFRRRGTADGYSLIEILVSLVIFATVILSVAMLLPQARLETTTSGVTSRMSRMAQTKTEQLRAADYDAPDLAAGWHQEEGRLLTMSRQSESNREFTIRWHVLVDQPAPHMKTVDVEVAYRPSKVDAGRVGTTPSKVLTFRTFIVDKGNTAIGERREGDPGDVPGKDRSLPGRSDKDRPR